MWPTVSLLVASVSEASGTVVSYLAVDPFFALETAADGLGWVRVATATLLWVDTPLVVVAVGVRACPLSSCSLATRVMLITATHMAAGGPVIEAPRTCSPRSKLPDTPCSAAMSD